MKERSIIFNGTEVRATLDGSKTQDRRAIAHTPHPDCPYHTIGGQVSYCPYGKPGDRLWGRETWGTRYEVDRNQTWIKYTAGPGGRVVSPTVHGRVCTKAGIPFEDKEHPATQMPRWASRITLEVVRVWVERVQDISRADAKAEGFLPGRNGLEKWDGRNYGNAEEAFKACWDSTAKPGEKWADNPWVWACEYKQLTERD